MPESRAQKQVLLPRTKSSLVTRKQKVPEKIVNMPPEILKTGIKMGIEDAGKLRGKQLDIFSDAREITTGGSVQLWDSGCFRPRWNTSRRGCSAGIVIYYL